MRIRRTLTLLRHGEAAVGHGQSADFDRPLTINGRKQLTRLGSLLKSEELDFDLTLYSPARRTSETLEIVSEDLEVGVKQKMDKIYNASLGSLLQVLQNTPSQFNHLLLVGHNPAVSHLQGYLTGDTSIIFSPGMMVRMEFEMEDWTLVSANTCRIIEVMQ